MDEILLREGECKIREIPGNLNFYKEWKNGNFSKILSKSWMTK